MYSCSVTESAMKVSASLPESLFNKVACLQPVTVLKRDTDTVVEAFITFFEVFQSGVRMFVSMTDP